MAKQTEKDLIFFETDVQSVPKTVPDIEDENADIEVIARDLGILTTSSTSKQR